jgi:hypothetical protein
MQQMSLAQLRSFHCDNSYRKTVYGVNITGYFIIVLYWPVQSSFIRDYNINCQEKSCCFRPIFLALSTAKCIIRSVILLDYVLMSCNVHVQFTSRLLWDYQSISVPTNRWRTLVNIQGIILLKICNREGTIENVSHFRFCVGKGDLFWPFSEHAFPSYIIPINFSGGGQVDLVPTV